MTLSTTVIVVGAGPVGAVMALALRRRGLKVIVVEALEQPEIECRAASCHPPTVAMLEELGLLEFGLEQGLVSPVFNYLDRPSGELIARFDIRAMKTPPRHAYVLQWEQYKIAQTVVKLLSDDADAELRMSTRVVGLTQDADKVRAEVELPNGERETIAADFLVGCDGGRSTIRRLADIAFDGFTWPERFLKIDTIFDFQSLRSELSNRNYFADPDQWLNLFKARGPDGEGMWRAVSPTLPEQTDEYLLSPEQIEQRLQLFCPKPGPYRIATVALYKVHQRVAATFNKGRVLLAGDAAHVNNPVGGMGMNGGIHDAMNLAERLEAIARGAAHEALLDQYTRQMRVAQLNYVQAQSIQNKQTLGETDPAERKRKLDDIRATGADPERHDAFIRRACLIDSFHDSRAVA
ncbi:MAG: FAD-dependent monooxygenase [Alphaproteobacteria bacterium]|nr:FAD-dependent monooxygenase [Alphaproteobacteria bacterium]